MPIMIPLKEASKISGMSYEFLRRICLQNKVRCLRSGNKWYIHREKLLEYLNGGDI